MSGIAPPADPADGSTGGSAVEASDVTIGARLGHYRLMELIGEGGFGAVYRAEQREPVRREVALKLIKPGMDSRQVIARFEAERQALAVMDHPNIAKVFDAGTTPAGRPYFVMELVKGVPITHYCDTHQLSTQQRLELFADVCGAVQHAHAKGVIHRDLKPSNVLVTLGDGGRAVPKVIDFGIAKATSARLTDRTLFTEYRQFIGTPEYMSPEQAEMSGLDIDTRTDVYSLGVLLYELLTGTTPFDAQQLRSAALDEVQRIIREQDPPRPSTRISALEKTPASPRASQPAATRAEEVARRRRTRASTLARELRGDLDWIVMKALEKDRTRRYVTAAELARDVQRHLNNEPVEAGPPSAIYRARKFARRHRAVAIATTAVAAALVLGTLGTTGGLLWALSERDRADAQAGEAQRQAEVAAAVNAFLNDDLLSAVSPSTEEGRGREVTVREVLDVAARRIDLAAAPGGRLADKPEVEAAIRATLGNSYANLGLFDAASPHFARALDLRRRINGEEHPLTLQATGDLANAAQGAGRLDEAERLMNTTLELARRRFGDEGRETLNALNNLALVHLDQQRAADAEAVARQAYDGHRRVHGEDDKDTLTAAHNLSLALNGLGRAEESEQLARLAWEGRRRVLGEDHRDTERAAATLAQWLLSRGRADEAEPILRASLESRRALLGPDHVETLTVQNNLAYLLGQVGRLAESEEMLRDVVERGRRTLGAEHPFTLGALHNLAAVAGDRGRLEEALELNREHYEANRRVRGEGHPDTLQSLNAMAGTLADMDRLDEAEPLFVQVYEGHRRAHGATHPATLGAMNNLGFFYKRRGRFAEAEPLVAEARAGFAQLYGAGHPNTLASTSNLGDLYNKLGRYDDAERLLGEAHPQAIAAFAPDHWLPAEMLMRRGVALAGLGRREEAEKALVEAHRLLETSLGADHFRTKTAAEELDRFREASDAPATRPRGG